LHQLDKAENNLVKARQYAPGSLEVMYNERCYTRRKGASKTRFGYCPMPRRASRRNGGTADTRRSLAILYQQLGQLYRDTQNYQAAVFTYEELGHLGRRRRPRARMMIMDTYRAAKDLTKAAGGGQEALAKYPADPSNTRKSCAVAWRERADEEAVKILRAQAPRE